LSKSQTANSSSANGLTIAILFGILQLLAIRRH
jgi:hypothetical protein